MKEENRTEFIIVRVSKKEKELLIKKAKIIRCGLSTYIRSELNLNND